MSEHTSPQTNLSVGAQFYDLHDRTSAPTRAHAVAAGLALHGITPGVGVLDFGAGTGTGTLALADMWVDLPVYAVEPSLAMRTALMTNLAARPDLHERVTVYPVPITDIGCAGFVDVVTAFWSLHMVSADAMPATAAAIASALVPGGVLVLETPAEQPLAEQHYERTLRLGEHTISYTGELVNRADGSGWSEFSYSWCDAAGRVLYQEADTYRHPPGASVDVAAHLTEAGLAEVFRFADPCGSTFSVYSASPN